MILSKLPAAIIGLGKTGISIAKYFDKNKVDYHIYDTRSDLIISKKIIIFPTIYIFNTMKLRYF